MLSPFNYEYCVIAGQLSDKENLRVYRRRGIFEKIADSAIPQKHPVAIILGGQNASGKSTLGEQFFSKYEQQGCGIVRIEGDALRDFHPKFDEYNQFDDKLMVAYTAKDSGIWTSRLIEDAARSRMNMMIETTMRSPDVVGETARRLAKVGYDVQAKIFVVSYDKSLLGCYDRYEELKSLRGAGRFVHDHSLVAAYEGMPKTLQRLQQEQHCSCIHLYTRTGTLFEGDYRTIDLLEIVQQERRREFTPDEVTFLYERWKIVCEKMIEREATKEEFAEMIRRINNRIQSMITEQYPQTNIDTVMNIYQSISRL